MVVSRASLDVSCLLAVFGVWRMNAWFLWFSVGLV